MRIRTIKPEFFKNELLSELPPIVRLLFQGLWCMADCSGRLEDRPRRIRAEVFPYEDVDCESGLDALHNAGFIVRYEAGEKHAIQVVNFRKHQRITGRESETTSAFPEPSHDEYGKQRGNNGETTGKQPGRQERINGFTD